MTDDFSQSTKYVAGFMFNADMTRVALIRKSKPKFQEGLLNGIGGKVEEGEIYYDAMQREFCEETDNTLKVAWKQFCTIAGDNNDGQKFMVDFYYGFGHPDSLKAREAEPVAAYDVMDIMSGKEKSIGNVPWLLALAKDHAQGVFPPKVVSVLY